MPDYFTLNDGFMYRVKPFDASGWMLPKRAFHKVYNLWWRDLARHWILKQTCNLAPSPPFTDKNSSYTIHSLLCARDFDMGVFAYKSLVLAAKQPFPFVFHDDGSLSTTQANRLKTHFPGCRVVMRSEADAQAARDLDTYPVCRAVRKTHVLMPKILDTRAFSSAARVGFMDSDVLFFKNPFFFLKHLQSHSSKSYFNRDIKTSYVLPPAQISQELGVPVLERVNSGLWVMNREDLDTSLVEQWLTSKTMSGLSDKYLLEQTLTAVLASASSSGAFLLPTEYDVAFEKKVEDAVCKHYVGRIRHGFELEGVEYLLNHTDFARRWKDFAERH